MTKPKPPKADPQNPKAIPPAAEPQPREDEEDKIPSFEGMVFSSYLNPADLTGSDWDSAQPIPEMPSTIWEDPPLTEEQVLKVIAKSSQKSALAEDHPDTPEEDGAGLNDTAEPADSDSLEPPAAPAEDLPAPGREPLNGSRPGLYGNLTNSSWLTLEKLRPGQGIPGEEFVAETPFYTQDIEELSLAGQAADLRETVHDEPVRSSEEAEEKPQPVSLSPVSLSLEASPTLTAEASPGLSPPSDQSSLPEVVAAETHLRDAQPEPDSQPELVDAVIPILSERPLFRSWYEPEPTAPDPTRIPHFGHLIVLVGIAFVGLVGAILLMRGALDLHFFGVSTMQQASTDIHYTIGFMASMYLISFAIAWFIFPFVWHKSLFAGLQWNLASTWQPRRMLILLSAAFICFLLAMVDELVLPGPANAPIDKLFDSRAAAWLLFAFGVTFAPFFEEIVFRGFLLPTLCTAFDWYGEKLTGNTAPPLDEGDNPHWSLFAMILGSIATSIPFALMHAEQTAWSLGPFLLLVAVSLVLCWARLATRSLAASVLVHASYNLLLFSLMLLGTGGFRNLDKM